MTELRKILFLCEEKNLKDVISFCLRGWGYEVILAGKESLSLSCIKKYESDLVIIGFPPGELKEHLNLCRELKDDYITTSLPVIVLIDKPQLRTHLLDLKSGIDDYLFKPPDPLDLRVRIEMALRRTQHIFYTNSLTKLEGGKIIHEILSQRLAKKERFSFAHVDIDNFKTFNDKYGYAKGDKVITQTAYILYKTVKAHGNKTKDFIGHIGGDDFVFITSPEKERKIAVELITQFDRLMPLHYSPQDRERSSIQVKDRQGKEWNAPLMSLTVAIVNNEYKSFTQTAEINEVVSGLKSYLKKLPGSNFMVERRKNNRGILKRQKQRKPETCFKDQTEVNTPPLGQLLLEQAGLKEKDLEQALNVHWRRGVPLGEVLKDLRLVSPKDIETVLTYQKKVKSAFAA
jgi:diguanylate cyclase (GGDEF)-like protein